MLQAESCIAHTEDKQLYCTEAVESQHDRGSRESARQGQ